MCSLIRRSSCTKPVTALHVRCDTMIIDHGDGSRLSVVCIIYEHEMVVRGGLRCASLFLRANHIVFSYTAAVLMYSSFVVQEALLLLLSCYIVKCPLCRASSDVK